MEDDIQNYLPTVMFHGTPCNINDNEFLTVNASVNFSVLITDSSRNSAHLDRWQNSNWENVEKLTFQKIFTLFCRIEPILLLGEQQLILENESELESFKNTLAFTHCKVIISNKVLIFMIHCNNIKQGTYIHYTL